MDWTKIIIYGFYILGSLSFMAGSIISLVLVIKGG